MKDLKFSSHVKEAVEYDLCDKTPTSQRGQFFNVYRLYNVHWDTS